MYKQKKYFKKKLTAIDYSIYDLEFKRFKTLEIREGIRKEYDALRSRVELLIQQITKESEKGGLKDKNIDEFKRLEDDKERLDIDVKKMKEQMDGLDIEVNGAKQSAEYPNGYNGLNQQLEALRELKVMVQEYIKQI